MIEPYSTVMKPTTYNVVSYVYRESNMIKMTCMAFWNNTTDYAVDQNTLQFINIPVMPEINDILL